MVTKNSSKAILCGLFALVTVLFDWYGNESYRIRPFSDEELYRYMIFLELPKRVLPPPDLANDWWMVVLVAGSTFFLGFIFAKVVMDFYQSNFIAIHNAYLKTITLFGLVMGFCAGYLLLISSYMLPLVWKIYLAIGLASLTFLGTYLVLRSPYRLYNWFKQKRSCA